MGLFRCPVVSDRCPGRHGPGTRPRGVNQHSRATCNRVRVPAVWTNSPGLLGLMSYGPQDRPSVLDDSLPSPWRRGVYQMSRVNRARSEGPWCRPPVPSVSVQGPMAREVDQISRATHAQVRWPVGLTSTPGRLGPVSEGPWGRPALPSTRARPQCPAGSSSCPGQHGPVPDCPGIQLTFLGDSQSGARGRGFDQLSWEPRASARGPMGSIDVLGDLGPDSSAHGFDQLSRVTRPRVRRPVR